MTHGRRLVRRGVCWGALACACAALGWATTGALVAVRAEAMSNEASTAQTTNMMLRLRSFAPGASAQLEIEPTMTGGRVRLMATNLPQAGAVTPGAHTFLVWATGGRIIRLGELRRDARGNAALEFAHPAQFERYSLIVTAEQSARADHPGGAPVFSTRANEVAALFSTPVVRRPRITTTTTTSAVAERTPAPRPVIRARRSEVGNDFYAGIEAVLRSDASARELTLVGTRLARRARGQARVAAVAGSAYVRARLRRVPSPARLGASRYVLWAMTTAGRSVYLGSLPRLGLNDTDTYVRAAGVANEPFDLLVTAERGRRVVGVRRVLATPRAQRVYKGRRTRH